MWENAEVFTRKGRFGGEQGELLTICGSPGMTVYVNPRAGLSGELRFRRRVPQILIHLPLYVEAPGQWPACAEWSLLRGAHRAFVQ
jgi:hypothetical protein